jgi:sugar-specific transcriptional regulator TrmB
MVLFSSKVMDALKSIGLNLYERKLWVALLSRGSATAGELSEIANVPRSRTYDTLQSLAEKGFVIVQPIKPIRFVAVPPLEALERAKRKVEEDMQTMRERIDELKQSPEIAELTKLHTTGLKLVQPSELTGTIRSRDSIFEHLGTMIKSAKSEVNIVATPEGLTELLVGNLSVLRDAKRRGVNIRIATPISERYADVIEALGSVADVRSVDEREVSLAGQFYVVDGKEVLFPLTDMKSVDASQDLAIWSKSEHAAGQVFRPLFELVWSHSKKRD